MNEPLFSDDFPAVTSNEGLAAAFARYPNYDRYYVSSGSVPDRRKRFEALWQAYWPYADSHFLGQYKHAFHARTWEMYLGAMLLMHGYQLEPAARRPSRGGGPDICVIAPTGAWIEAVAPGPGVTGDAVPPDPVGQVFSPPEDQLLLRLTQAMDSKRQQHQHHRDSGVIGAGDAYVVAVNGGIRGPQSAQLPLMLKCLFGIGHLAIPLSGGEPYWTSRRAINKQSGDPVPIALFEDTAYGGISAAIYSEANVLNHSKELGADCMMIHNPEALNPIADGAFAFMEQWRRVGDQLRRSPPR